MRKKKKHKIPVVGITGVIGSGKTMLAEVFEKNGAFVINADEIGKEVLENDFNVINNTINLFGNKILEKNGKISRSKLADIVFSSKDSLENFNAIIHPPMIKTIEEKVKNVLKKDVFPMIVVDAALIFEAGVEDKFDYIIAVKTKINSIINRLIAEKNIAKQEIKRRIKSQISQKDKIGKSHYVIENNGTKEDFKFRAVDLFNKIFSDFKNKR